MIAAKISCTDIIYNVDVLRVVIGFIDEEKAKVSLGYQLTPICNQSYNHKTNESIAIAHQINTII